MKYLKYAIQKGETDFETKIKKTFLGSKFTQFKKLCALENYFY